MLPGMRTKPLTLTGLFVATGLMLPYLTGHAFGVPGTILLPMHIPVLLCGLLCGPKYGALCGAATPFLSSLMTGMPALYPMLPILTLQLVTVGLLSGLLYHQWQLSLYPALLLSISAGWCVYGLTFSVLLFGGGGQLRAPSVLTAVVTGMPGTAIQLLLIPMVLLALKKYQLTPSNADTPHAPDPFAQAKALVAQGTCSCAVIQNGRLVHSGDGQGLAPLLYLYQNQRELLTGALVADKLIGKAAAMILVLGGVSSVHGVTMSAAAKEYLKGRGITVSYECLIDVITNRNRDGICPIERCILHLDDPVEGLVRIQDTIKQLMSVG